MVSELTQVSAKFSEIAIKNGERVLTMDEAEAILTALKGAYNLGARVMNSIISKFLAGKRTMWDLAMAFTSAANDETLFKIRGVRSQARFSSAGTVLVALPGDQIVKNCQTFIQKNKLPVVKLVEVKA